jgi:hypothetical protein
VSSKKVVGRRYVVDRPAVVLMFETTMFVFMAVALLSD